MLYYIYDKVNEHFVSSIHADDAAAALQKFAEEMKLGKYVISHGDTLKTNGFSYWAVSGKK